MRWRYWTWLLLSLLFLALIWMMSGPFSSSRRRLVVSSGGNVGGHKLPGDSSNGLNRRQGKFTNQRAIGAGARRFPHRLTNTLRNLGQLARCPTAILLENALLDTARPLDIRIPAGLRAQGEAGSYIVQARGPLTDGFRASLKQAGATTAAYIPNNAYLVRLSGAGARELAGDPRIQAVLPFEPYYKLKEPLLTMTLEEAAANLPQTAIAAPTPGEAGTESAQAGGSPSEVSLNLLLFPDAFSTTAVSVTNLTIQVLAEELSPFGRLLKVRASSSNLALLASLPGIQELELARLRRPANDLSRVLTGIAPDPQTPVNYLGLTGTNVVINLNDTGVDTNQADLIDRVLVDFPLSGVDTNGHGTHVAGIIIGSGASSTRLTNVPGSPMPALEFQFRGKAPAARLLSMVAGLGSGSAKSDTYLQQTAAATNAFISNNSWLYDGDYGYDMAAASYDAAVRDALPQVTGSQPLLFVFAAGNAGHGTDDGAGGLPDSIQSPATAKNVITVGAIELPRFITNETWSCSNGPNCQTNQPWFALTDSTNEVAGFSSRGNVGIGVEGDFGRFKPDVVAPGTFVISSRSGLWDQAAYYSEPDPFASSADTNQSVVLSNLNETLGPFYRFESGTSLSAADVSGTLALMQEFFQQRLGRTNSPALMKALLINGARSVGNLYDFRSSGGTNFQGWGLINLPHSIPAALTNQNSTGNPLVFYDQDPSSALATGQSETRFVTLSPGARNQPLRVTLVWTDPPGNPLASIKLVNDLDLIVTNLDTGEVFFGNDIPAGSLFNQPWDIHSAPNIDSVNNVENVYIAPSLATNCSVTVYADHVNVNAVTAHPDDVVQDYALVISSGDGQVWDAISVSNNPPAATASPLITQVTNSLVDSSGDMGALLLHQRAGASTPLLGTNTVLLADGTSLLTIGMTNQWHFYVVTNEASYTNAAFVVCQPRSLSIQTLPGASNVTSGLAMSNNSLGEPDLDLYVSRDPGLTNLDPNVLAMADASVGRGGTEMLIYSNATPGAYYIGVKSESQEAAEYTFLGLLCEQPFAQIDAQGNQLVRGIPSPALIPGATAAQPGEGYVFCLAPYTMPVHRVIVTNTITTPSMADLAGTLSHNHASVVLNNHSLQGALNSQAFVYDDSAQADVPGAQPADGPGSLRVFDGMQGAGLWLLSVESTNNPGTDESLAVFLESQQDMTGGISSSILPGACRDDFIYLQPGTTNLTANVSFNSGSGPFSTQLCPIDVTTNCAAILTSGSPGNVTVVADDTTHPPINQGLYRLRVCNLGPDVASITAVSTTAVDPNPPGQVTFTFSGDMPIPDDALSTSTLYVTNTDQILSTEVGVRIDHPRVSDLMLNLVSPCGARVLLAQNRGGLSTNGMGINVLVTNMQPVSSTGGPQASTNTFDTGQTSGMISINYDMYALPDDMRIYYQGNLIYDSGLVSYSGSTNISYGPGNSTFITIVMNEGGNYDTNTAWFYIVTSTRVAPLYFTFTENTNLTVIPIKFAPTPLTNIDYSNPGFAPSSGIFYLPEQSLNAFKGESAAGLWTLEIKDARAGATNPPPVLQGWDLSFLFRDSIPKPIALSQAQLATNALGPGQIQWFYVDAPPWISFATNSLEAATAPLNLLFNQTNPPTGTNAGDVFLLRSVTNSSQVLQTNGVPPLLPGARFYLGVQNTNAATLSFVLAVGFDIANVVTLSDGVPFANSNPGPPGPVDYYRYTVSTNAVRAQFEINGPTAGMALVAREGLPLPSLTSYDYSSANSGTNDQLIVVHDFSNPVALAPGDWYLAAINLSGKPSSYSILATEFASPGTNFLLTGQVTAGDICLTWPSLPGVHYYVQGEVNLTDPAWTTLCSTITATDYSTTFCIALASPFEFFRVREGLVLSAAPLNLSPILYSPNGVLLQWTAAPGTRFSVQWNLSLSVPDWSTFTNVVTSSTSSFSFFDDGSQSGGLSQTRFYRLLQLP
ncbi:MAG TPA: S8 family serine peptidase [Verrucomicrobiae bacterium]|nr:S8 family serine peptidase [Verrucomicrobiae bacterium]